MTADSAAPPIPARSWAIIDSTLREGEQFARGNFKTGDKIEIARALDAFGVEFIEVTTPMVSAQTAQDIRQLTRLGLRARILTHVRCHMDDVQRAVDLGVDGLDLLFGTSSFLREFPTARTSPRSSTRLPRSSGGSRSSARGSRSASAPRTPSAPRRRT